MTSVLCLIGKGLIKIIKWHRYEEYFCRYMVEIYFSISTQKCQGYEFIGGQDVSKILN